MRGVPLYLAGGWLLCQLFGGEMLQRLGIIPDAPTASTVTLTQANLTTPGEAARDRRAAAPSPVPSYGGKTIPAGTA